MSEAGSAKDKLIAQLTQRIAELREEVARLQWQLGQYEQREEEEDVLENYEPKAVVVIEKSMRYEPTVKGPFLNRGAAELWANRYEPQAGEVVHVLETEPA